MENPEKREGCPQCLYEINHQYSCSSYIGEKDNCHKHNREKFLVFRKWTDGQEYERSRRSKHVQEQATQQYVLEVESSAYSSSLHHDENTWEILNQFAQGRGPERQGQPGFKMSSKREDMDHKLANRDMVQQIGCNPFLGQSDYVRDIQVSSQYLKPINTQVLDY